MLSSKFSSSSCGRLLVAGASIPGGINRVAVYGYSSVTMELPQVEFRNLRAALEFFAPAG
jgi:hypothetical protein